MLSPQQEAFLKAYLDPNEETWGNAYQSALKAGYSEEYAQNITGQLPKWLERARNLKNTRSDKSVYLLKAGNYYKVGVAGDVHKRINWLQTGNPYKIELVSSVRAHNANKAEKELLWLLKDYRVIREWFSFPKTLVNSIVRDMKIYG